MTGPSVVLLAHLSTGIGVDNNYHTNATDRRRQQTLLLKHCYATCEHNNNSNRNTTHRVTRLIGRMLGNRLFDAELQRRAYRFEGIGRIGGRQMQTNELQEVINKLNGDALKAGIGLGLKIYRHKATDPSDDFHSLITRNRLQFVRSSSMYSIENTLPCLDLDNVLRHSGLLFTP